MLFLSVQTLIKPSKTRHLRNLIALCVLLTPMYSIANDHFSSWSDKTICRLAKTTPANTEYQAESSKRGLNCGEAVTSSSVVSDTAKTTSIKLKVAMKPDSGDWLKESIYPFRLKAEMLSRVQTNNGFAMADFDGDGIDDLFHLGMPAVSGLIYGGDSPEITNSSACDPNSGHPCFHSKPWVAVFLIKNDVTYRIWDGKKQDWVITTGPSATEVSELVIDDNSIELKAQEANGIRVSDFNGDGVPDIFVNDVSMQIKVPGKTHAVRPGKNDLYFLSQPDGTWLESTMTHVTGTGVRKGKGLIKFTHGASLGDIDGDGDIDIVVSSSKWVGNNGEVMCYVNQGDGYMKVRKCGNQWGFEVELGDIDNDGDLDIAFGGTSKKAKQEWADVDGMAGCISYNNCPRNYNGILLNDGKGNFNKRGFEFSSPVDSSNGIAYNTVPAVSVADLDGDGDLDVVRSHVGRLYHGGALTIEENIGNGKFRTIMLDEMCDGPKKKSDWGLHEGVAGAGCFINGFKFGDFNKDGLVDIVANGSQLLKYNQGYSQRVVDGTVYLSTGKLKYDTVYPDDKNYPLVDFGAVVGTIPKENATQQDIEDELAAFEAELAAELNQ